MAYRYIYDLIILGKPRSAALLTFIGVASFIYASTEINLIKILLFTGLGLLATMGSNSINNYIDLDIDSVMERTRNRPLPRGVFRPIMGLLYGIILFISSILMYYIIFNFISSIIALFGGLYYIVIYTLILKRRTVWNTVIGGIAGCIPVIVGWVAARGHLDSPIPILLSLVVFIWTPGHFWRLSLKYVDDYRRVKLPMLPVVSSPRRTKYIIIILDIVLLGTILLLTALIGDPYYHIFSFTSIILIIYSNLMLFGKRNPISIWYSFKLTNIILALIFLGIILSKLI